MKDKSQINILPSLLAADMGRLAEECVDIRDAGADGIHLDIMDGHFVGNLSMGPDFVKMVRQEVPDLYRHVHLMVTKPHELADAFIDAGAQTLLFHVEARSDIRELIDHIRSREVKPGLVLNPETPIDAVRPYLELIDELLFMTVHPGFGGQKFIGDVLPKIKRIHTIAPDLLLSVDGGITLETAPLCAKHGASLIIAGTALFKANDRAGDIALMRSSCERVFPEAQA